MEKTDILIIGAGVVGLSIAYKLSSTDKNITIIDRNPSYGQETSSRNSEVIHSGIYYPKNSLKSETCLRGKELLYELCRKNNIPHKLLGKILISTEKEESAKLRLIYQNALDCGIKNTRFLEQKELKELEPSISADEALLSPDTGIIDSHVLMHFLYNAAKAGNANVAFSVEVIDIIPKRSSYEVVVKEPHGGHFCLESKSVINCAGLHADKVAEMVSIDTTKKSYKIHYCKGQYFRLRAPQRFGISHPIYPPPTAASLGIHITPDMSGGLRLGPDARYITQLTYDINEQEAAKFFSSVKRFLPSLEPSDLMPDTAGVRPKLYDETQNFADFVIHEESDIGLTNFINTIGIESPGLTASLAIAEHVRSIVKKTI